MAPLLRSPRSYRFASLPLDIRMTVHNHLKSIAPDSPESPAAVALAELQKLAGGDLPQEGEELANAVGDSLPPSSTFPRL